MRPFLIAASLLASAAPGMVMAQQPAPQPPRPMADGVLTRAEALARADRRFDAIDTDRDGRISAAERAALPQRAPRPAVDAGTPPPPPAPGGPRGFGGARMLERADTDRDGVITREEYRAQAGAAFDRQDGNKDGRIDATERQQWRDQRMERRGDRAAD
ncbi:hypothetical protein [Sphingomonas sp. Leaf25]|uniref:hypothetical protein n=1 Tax=Sphingomonas sp. Leaf25 TaxID=1735692 RepID=UPI0006FB7022|nr:hypothetical protein [Sphingomonas sp. Leaf25]KQM98851.1 hypothetical protein ASE78_06445 [Sphingomonas sp. Leaf25]